MLSLEQGAELVGMARRTIEARFSIFKGKPQSGKFTDFLGCFVTIHKGGQLRGCIGFPEPVMPLHEGIVKAAEHAAFADPRFPSLQKDEVSQVTIEVSVLTKPKRIDVRNPEDYLQKIQIGKDGIVIRGTYNSGLLLPQVATEYRWDALTFLRQACLKANLKADDWQDFDKVRVYRFQSQVFSESSPNGEIIQIM